ncbi:MAG: hypothetical protein EA376_13450 [Phycisphaeraceae bacterium]|nr:MAG: hypothetical protein EA376_13450 [Phycisphaeraceae bacterium]
MISKKTMIVVKSVPALLAAAAFFATVGTVQGELPEATVTAMDPLRPDAIYLRTGNFVADTPSVSLSDRVRSLRAAQELRIAGPAGDGAEAIAVDRKRHVIQLDGPMTRERRAALVQAGVVIQDYVPANAFVVSLDAADSDAVDGLDFVRWHTDFKADWKIEPGIGQRELFTEERQQLAQQGLMAITITLFQDATDDEVQQVARWLNDRPGATLSEVGDLGGNPMVTGVVRPADVNELAGLGAVQFIEQSPEITMRNSSVRSVVQDNTTGSTPLWDNGLRGAGQIIGIMDGRVNPNHCSFSDTGPFGDGHRKIQAYNTNTGNDFHGNHVTATAVGDAFDTSSRRGVAYEGRFVFHIPPSLNQTAAYNRLQLHHSQGARIHSNSWGNDGTTAYDSLARGFDLFAYDHEESLVLLAVSNLSTLRNPENSKNLLAVGATRAVPQQNLHCTGGIGPTSDGRRKPEIYAPGCNTVSASTGSCTLGSQSGTSMACPAVAGTGMLVRQYYMEGFYPTGAANIDDAFTPSAALVKATLLNSAQRMTGVSGPYPGNLQGWGRLQADTSLHFPGDSRTLIVHDVFNANGLDTAETDEYEFEVLGGAEQLRVTMVFTDYPGAAFTSFAAVNDLDLEVVSPSGDVYRGNVFSGNVSVTGGSKDDRNNVEQVHVSTPETGVWTARIVGASVSQGRQGYGLVITGEVSEALVIPCPADFIGDGAVGSADLAILLGEWGNSGSIADLTGDNNVGSGDLGILLGSWGPCE